MDLIMDATMSGIFNLKTRQVIKSRKEADRLYTHF